MGLQFNTENYAVKTLEMEGQTLHYRAFEHIPYVEHPADKNMQVLNIYVPECYYNGQNIGRYSLHTAPIFLPNTVGGYMPGPVDKPGKNFHGETNTIFYALLHGYVVVSPGIRGRGMKNSEGKYIGTAPAAICDLKAVVRFIRSNAEKIPGDTQKIISNGTSAGGALSALLGATGNHPDYEPYLEQMGAAKARDDIFAASCYCPITNLDHADMAYEWEFNGLNDYYGKFGIKISEDNGEPQFIKIDGTMTEAQCKMSAELKAAFPEYVNSLCLKGEDGKTLSLDENGDGSFKEFVAKMVCKSAQDEINKGGDLSSLDWIHIEDNTIKDIDFDKYIAFRTRMKDTPAFDNAGLGTPENELFGLEDIKYRHFTSFGKSHSTVNGTLAEEKQIKMMNPMNYIGDKDCVTAKHYRIRHGAADRDTSLAISALLTAKLKNAGIETDFAYPWGVVHSGDYDLEELFAWIDKIC